VGLTANDLKTFFEKLQEFELFNEMYDPKEATNDKED